MEVGTLVDGVVETFLPTRVVLSARPKLWLVALVCSTLVVDIDIVFSR